MCCKALWVTMIELRFGASAVLMNDTGLLQSSTHETRTHRGLWEHVTPHRHTCTVTELPLTNPSYETTQRCDVNLPCHGVSELLEERLVRAALLAPETTLKHRLGFGPGHGAIFGTSKYVKREINTEEQ